jgi:hypothetical protein
MNRTRSHRASLAWLLYFSVLFSALVCSIGQGQLAGLQLSGIDGVYCSAGSSAAAGDQAIGGASLVSPAGVSGCVLCSSVAGLAFAVLFALLSVLPPRQIRPNPALLALVTAVRYLWPSANPRASPFFA